MSKIILLGDTHVGMRSDNVHFIEFQRLFYENQLIPYCIENNIKQIIQVGDLFDKRQTINFRSLYNAKKMFFDKLKEHNIVMNVLVGNHDMYFLDSLSINAPELLLQEYDNIQVIQNPVSFTIGNCDIDLIPWMCKENYEEITKFISNSKSEYCLGHFHIAGFPMYKGMIAEGGLESSDFKKYKKVWSGHFHTHSESKNIEYIGTPMEITWQDCNDQRGFIVFDTIQETQEFIPNQYNIFYKLEYNQETFDQLSFNYDYLKNKFVKLIIQNKTDAIKYDQFLNKVYQSGCHDVSIIENFEEYSKGDINEDVVIENTLDVVNSYIDSIEITSDKIKLKTMLQNLYIKAINEES